MQLFPELRAYAALRSGDCSICRDGNKAGAAKLVVVLGG